MSQQRRVRSTIRIAVRMFILSVVLGFGAGLAQAQDNSSVTGVITDPQGNIVVGVDVKLANLATAFSATAKTNANGVYIFAEVPPAEGYSLTVSRDGFRTITIEKVTLSVGTKETRDIQLIVGDVKVTVEVTAHGEATLDTSDASIGNTIDAQRVEDLPSLFRTNAAALMSLQPGVETDANDDARNGVVAGTRGDQSNITLDGLDVNDQRAGFAFTTVGNTPIDSISEVHVIVAGNDASYGRSAGGQIELVTKSGTNEWHGSASEFNRNTDFAANDYFNNLAGVPRPKLIRNQFGGDLGGPIIKNKLFFFFDYLGLRQTQSQQIQDIVPLDALRNGELNYINNGPSCSAASTLIGQPSCISTLSAAQVQALDPAGLGPDAPLVAVFASRYPMANTTALGDGVNTGGFIFTAPLKVASSTYIGRVDYNLTSSHRLFGRATWVRANDGQTNTGLFPGDPAPFQSVVDHSRSWVVGDTWTISPTMTNQAVFGLTRQVLDFVTNFEPTAPLNFSMTGGLTSPFPRFDGGQTANNPVPEVRDVFSWVRGKHTLQFGGDIKPVRIANGLQNSAGFDILGIGGQIQTLGPALVAGNPNPLRPSNIFGTAPGNDAGDTAQVEAQYDGIFPVLLGRYAQTLARYNYDSGGNPFPLGNFQNTRFHYNAFEFFAQDVWNVRSDLTITYGLRWQFHSVPFEQNGISAIPSIYEQQLFTDRLSAANAGVNGPLAVPLVSYGLAGPTNHAPGFYQPSYTDFAPRLGLAYSPAFTDGVLGKLFGNRKSSIRAGAGVNYDQQEGTLSFEFTQQTFIFANQFTGNFGGTDPTTALLTSPRFQGFNTGVPPQVPPGVTTSPITPNLDANGNPVGLVNNGATFFQLNNPLRTPYEMQFNVGIQRELPGDLLVDVEYVGKFGRRLYGIGDAAQQINFKDPASGQFLYTAFGNVQKQLQQGVNPAAVTAQPFFENQVNNSPFIQGQGAGSTCQSVTGLSCTALSALQISGPWTNGDVSTTDLVLATDGLLQPNTGLLAQTGAAGYYGNFSASSYNGLLLTIRKRLSRGLTFDFDYALAHSIDNLSDVQNEANQFTGGGIAQVCDLRDLHVCRGNSKFDARQTVSANFTYQLPVGHGQPFLGEAPKWLDEVIGGWKTSGIVTYHTGFPVTTTTGTFPIGFTYDSAPVFVGPKSALRESNHIDANGKLQFFANQTNALGAFQFPFGGGTGNRDVLYGPHFSNVDMALLKDFTMPWSDRQKLQFRAEAFNVFNHPAFADPAGAIENQSQFGEITSTANTARQLQIALVFSF
jgi:Carboxypeptidase regulatory-like domain